MLEKVSRDLDRETYLLRQVMRDVENPGGSRPVLDSLARSYEAQSPEATGDVSLRAAEICDHFGADARTDYLRYRIARRQQLDAMARFGPSESGQRTDGMSGSLLRLREGLRVVLRNSWDRADSVSSERAAAFAARLKQHQSRIGIAPDSACLK